MKADAKRHQPGGRLDLFPARDIDGGRLFGEHGDTPLGSLTRHDRVQVMGRADMHRVKRLALQHANETAISVAAVLIGEGMRPLGQYIGTGNK
ncbi:hypothetical protein SDC9_147567 [bioreactor metagenome]|uniref:Uncharacterized protein n=1 Tax=bioreactor metagenome TaxID=1076179 RepID=A0A645EIG2_9ZZZZ